jgi:Class III cytochrome C family
MRTSVVIISAALLVIGLFLASAYSQEDMQFVDNSPFDHPRRSEVPFDHDAHNQKAGLDDCTVCHHVYDEHGVKSEFDSSEDQACADCHQKTDTGRQPGLMKAFHLNCKGCHLRSAKGPIVCGECHPKH